MVVDKNITMAILRIVDKWGWEIKSSIHIYAIVYLHQVEQSA